MEGLKQWFSDEAPIRRLFCSCGEFSAGAPPQIVTGECTIRLPQKISTLPRHEESYDDLVRPARRHDAPLDSRRHRGSVLQTRQRVQVHRMGSTPVFRNGMSWKSPSASMASGFSPFWTLNSNRYNLGPDQFSHGITWVGESRPQNPGQIASRPVTRNRSASTRPQNGSHV